jgi:protein-L-isoaspartate(D-aspartate) O-methyltransferase
MRALRENMVRYQIAARGVSDDRVLDAMRAIPREAFMPEELAEFAYEDTPLPIEEGQTISQPYVVALMTAAIEPGEQDRVLEIGTGSGYQTAVLAELVRRVCSVERLMSLAIRARRILEELGYTSAVVKTSDGTYGWPDEAPFERIIVTAGAPTVPAPLFQQLAEGGRVVVPVGGPQSQVLHVVEKVDGRMRLSTDCGCTFVKLVGKYGWET